MLSPTITYIYTPRKNSELITHRVDFVSAIYPLTKVAFPTVHVR